MRRPLLIGIAISMVLLASVLAISISGGGFFILALENSALPNFDVAEADSPKTHEIEIHAVAIADSTDIDIACMDVAPPEHLHHMQPCDEIFAYKMVSHMVKSDEEDDEEDEENVIEDRIGYYSADPTIPGPTIVINEGDTVLLTLRNENINGCVSVHTHGVHYDKASDGTNEVINAFDDECVGPEGSTEFEYTEYTYIWSAGAGTAGTWPYHDHTLGPGPDGDFTTPDEMIGSSSKGLFGTLIINPASQEIIALDGDEPKSIELEQIEKEFILWMIGTRFEGMEIDYSSNGQQTPLGENPMLEANLNDLVRFHILGLGTDSCAFHKMAPMKKMGMTMEMCMDHLPEEFHTFHLHAHRWLEPGTTNVIDTREIGPAETHTFVVKAGDSVGPGDWMYHCHVKHHMDMGMGGIFRVT